MPYLLVAGITVARLDPLTLMIIMILFNYIFIDLIGYEYVHGTAASLV